MLTKFELLPEYLYLSNRRSEFLFGRLHVAELVFGDLDQSRELKWERFFFHKFLCDQCYHDTVWWCHHIRLVKSDWEKRHFSYFLILQYFNPSTPIIVNMLNWRFYFF